MSSTKRISSILWSVDEALYAHHPTVQEGREVGRRLTASAVVETARETGLDACTILESAVGDLQEAVRELMEK